MIRWGWGTGALGTRSSPWCRCLWPPPEGRVLLESSPGSSCLLSPAGALLSAWGKALPTCTFSFAQLEPRLNSMRGCMASEGAGLQGNPHSEDEGDTGEGALGSGLSIGLNRRLGCLYHSLCSSAPHPPHSAQGISKYSRGANHPEGYLHWVK